MHESDFEPNNTRFPDDDWWESKVTSAASRHASEWDFEQQLACDPHYVTPSPDFMTPSPNLPHEHDTTISRSHRPFDTASRPLPDNPALRRSTSTPLTPPYTRLASTLRALRAQQAQSPTRVDSEAENGRESAASSCPVHGPLPARGLPRLAWLREHSALADNRPSCKEFLASGNIREHAEILGEQSGTELYHKAGWQPGGWGKATLHGGELHTWQTAGEDGSPSHYEMMERRGWGHGDFHITPDGTLQLLSAENPEEAMAHALALRPDLKPWDNLYDFLGSVRSPNGNPRVGSSQIPVYEYPTDEDDWVTGGYLGRHPVLFDGKALHIGEDDETHTDLVRRLVDKGALSPKLDYSKLHEGWLGANPERDSYQNYWADNQGKPNEVGWYTYPGDEAHEALKAHAQAQDADSQFDFEKFAAENFNELQDEYDRWFAQVEEEERNKPVTVHEIHGSPMGSDDEGPQEDEWGEEYEPSNWTKRRPLLYSPEYNQLIVGDYDTSHTETAYRASQAGLPRPSTDRHGTGWYHGWIGPNPSADKDDMLPDDYGAGYPIEREGEANEYGWYVPLPLEHHEAVGKALNDHFNATKADTGFDFERFASTGQEQNINLVNPHTPFGPVMYFPNTGNVYSGAVTHADTKLGPEDDRRHWHYRGLLSPLGIKWYGQGPEHMAVEEAFGVPRRGEEQFDFETSTGQEHNSAIGLDGHKLWWDKGKDGRGLISPEGWVHTWNEDEATHAQRLMALNVNHADKDKWSRISIGPGGKVGVFHQWEADALRNADSRLRPSFSPYIYDKATDKTLPNPNYKRATNSSIIESTGQMTSEMDFDRFGKTSAGFTKADLFVCGYCGSHAMSEPHEFRGKWTQICNNCHRTRVVDPTHPFLQSLKRQSPYPQMLQELNGTRPMNVFGKTAEFDFENINPVGGYKFIIVNGHPHIEPYMINHGEIARMNGLKDEGHAEALGAINPDGGVEFYWGNPERHMPLIQEQMSGTHYQEGYEFGNRVATMQPMRALAYAHLAEDEGDALDAIMDDEPNWRKPVDEGTDLDPWSLGDDGKGILHTDGSVTTWNDTNVHHQDVERLLKNTGKRTKSYLDWIHPDGTVMMEFNATPDDYDAVRDEGFKPVSMQDESAFDFENFNLNPEDEYVGLND